MPPRYAYWTIIIDDAPTAFRARDRADLLPTFRQLTSRNPNATIKWFAGGRLWESPEEARATARGQQEPRSPDWRPGGRHQDPRARFQKREPKPRRTGTGPRADAAGMRSEQKAGASSPDNRHKDGARSGKRPNDRQPWSGRDRPGATGAPDRNRRNQRSGSPGGPGNAGKRERPPWTKDRNRKQVVGKGGGKPGTGKMPGEAGPLPPTPARPPGPDRPPRPGQEPGPDVPRPEAIKSLPEPPERAK
jgi:hypothetical protein